MLKTSQRNCALNLSEMRGTGLFLNREKSKFLRPGAITELRPELPRRFAQVPVIEPKGRHCAAISGVATGRAKQFRLRYPRWLSLKFELTGLQPDTRSGNA